MGGTPDTSCNADTDATATMFLTSLTGAAPVALARANSPGVGDGTATALTNSFPKWAPYIQSLDEMNKLDLADVLVDAPVRTSHATGAGQHR